MKHLSQIARKKEAPQCLCRAADEVPRGYREMLSANMAKRRHSLHEAAMTSAEDSPRDDAGAY